MYTCLPRATQPSQNQSWDSPHHPSEGDVGNSCRRRLYQSSVSIKNNTLLPKHLRTKYSAIFRDQFFRSRKLGGLNWGSSALSEWASHGLHYKVRACDVEHVFLPHTAYTVNHGQRIMSIRCSYVQAVLNAYKMTQPGLFLSPYLMFHPCELPANVPAELPTEHPENKYGSSRLLSS
jgi:hypothetical protein